VTSNHPDIGGEVFDQALDDPALAGIVHGYDSGVHATLPDGTDMSEREFDREIERIITQWREQDRPEPATWRTTMALLGLAVAGCGVWFGGGLWLGWCLWGGAA